MTPPRSDAPAKKTLASRVALAVREDIMSGALPPGGKLNLDALRRAFGISVSSVREAIGKLVTDGLVTFEEHRGYRVAPVSGAHLAEVTALRAELEGLALRRSIARGGVEWESDVLGALYRLTHTLRDGARDGGTAGGASGAGAGGQAAQQSPAQAWEAVHRAFHRSLMVQCGMPQLLQFCDVLHHQHERYRRMDRALTGALDGGAGPAAAKAVAGDRDADAEHSAIADAAVRHDTGLAVRLLDTHIRRNGAALLARLDAAGALPPAG